MYILQNRVLHQWGRHLGILLSVGGSEQALLRILKNCEKNLPIVRQKFGRAVTYLAYWPLVSSQYINQF